MSVQAGIWNFCGGPIDGILLEKIGNGLARHAPDSASTFLDGSIGLLYRPFHRNMDSRRESQPHVTPAKNVITWEGRLDNREALAAMLPLRPISGCTDVDIVGAAFDQWGPTCFQKFVGDWAFAGWNPAVKKLTLAIDYMAIKHLYYYRTSDAIIWCSDLETLVLELRDQFRLDDLYVAGYLSHAPAPGHTPYLDIRTVEPGHFVEIHHGVPSSLCYWYLDPEATTCHKTDAGYEEHFRHMFRQAVSRRLRSDAPILADLSGGLDSSSIVCMADDIIAKVGAGTPRIDTYSHYDLGEPDGDDLQYVKIVEKKRGREGHRLNIGNYPNSILPERSSFFVAPGRVGYSPELRQDHLRIWERGGYKTSLSGVGGDELLGGVPDPGPELADLLVQGRFLNFARQTAAWSLVKRMPWIHLAIRAIALLAPSQIRALCTHEGAVAPWIHRGFAKKWRLSLRQLGPSGSYGTRLPSRQEFARTVAALARTQASELTCTSGLGEKQYPYLDRDLVEFLFSIPREQLIRPGQRRSLMRRALCGLVPDEILSRRTKGTVSRRPLVALAQDWRELEKILDSPLVAQFGYVDKLTFLNALLGAKSGNIPQLLPLLRALSLELWLRDVTERGLVRPPAGGVADHESVRSGFFENDSAQWERM